MDNLTTLIANACDLKQQMNDHFDGLYSRIGDPRRFDKEQRLTVLTVNQQYGPALRKIVEATTTDDLIERRERLHKRLNEGWDYLNGNAAHEDAHAVWEALLLEYEVIGDCLDHTSIVSRTLGRIKHIEGMTHASLQV